MPLFFTALKGIHVVIERGLDFELYVCRLPLCLAVAL